MIACWKADVMFCPPMSKYRNEQNSRLKTKVLQNLCRSLIKEELDPEISIPWASKFARSRILSASSLEIGLFSALYCGIGDDVWQIMSGRDTSRKKWVWSGLSHLNKYINRFCDDEQKSSELTNLLLGISSERKPLRS